MIYKNEIWRDIPNYEGLYQVSNLGRIKSYVKCNAHPNIPHILKPYQNKDGYLRVDFRSKKGKVCSIHRLVALAFIPNPNKFPIVNHIDGNKKNNNVYNLEWCTYSRNVQHAFDNKLNVPKYGKEHHNHALVNQYDLEGNFIKLWYGFHEIDRILGFDYRNIFACCNGKQPTAYGYKWEYARR